ncbi:phage antirepressor N-terminal domain-containing protein [Photobacterium sp. 53610]|uniref:phage antirepressor N-terminal domain-containing protein n=1 Tax=Photobacterium sp. 53610 TaxID=3102789 RepID=UPI002EDA20A8
MATAITVPFHGSNLFVVEQNNQPYTPMKPIVEGMGLNWASQFTKLNCNPERWGIVKIAIPTNGDVQSAVCLPLRKLFGWLQTISPNKVKATIRDKVIQYQNECDDVLWQYWTNQTTTHHQPQLISAPQPNRRVKLSELIFELAELRGVPVHDVHIHYSQVFGNPCWPEGSEVSIAMANAKLKHDIAEARKYKAAPVAQLEAVAAELGMKVISEYDLQALHRLVLKQQAEIDQMNKSLIKLARQQSLILGSSVWG